MSDFQENAPAPGTSYEGAKRFSTPKKTRLAPTGTGTDPNEHTDSFKIGPFTIYAREAAPAIVEADGAFSDSTIRELGLLERAEREVRRDEDNGVIERVNVDEWDDVVYDRAIQLLNTEAFRSGPKGLEHGRLYDALVAKRYEDVIFGTSDDPDYWGGLVAWSGPVASDNPDELKVVMKKPMKLELYQRLLALARYGMNDELFRRALGRGRR